jgi:GNAT superfamily N-acetyltransferase
MQPIVRQMTPADVEPAAAAILRDDWGDRRLHLAFAATHPSCRAFVADVGGVLAGTGIATVNGPVGWIGTIWVDPAWRGRGIGLALTEATIDAAEASGCRTLLLVATQAGRPMYERLGFTLQTEYRIVEAPGLASGPTDGRLRAFRPDDLVAMAALDRAATGEDRAHVLAAFATPSSARCLVDDAGTLHGFVVRAPWGGGATIAPDPDDAAAILHARRLTAGVAGRVRAGLLADNLPGLARLEREGWTPAWHAPRMVRGKPITWDPLAIWGQFNHAMG